VIDHEQIRAADSKAAIDAAKSFVDRLTPIDRVAVVTLPNGKVEVDLTTNKERVKAALGTVVGRAVRRTSISNISLNEALTVLEEVLDGDKVFTKELQDRECKFAPDESFCRTRVVQEALDYARETERNTKFTLIALKDFLNGLGSVEAPTAVLFMSGTLARFPGYAHLPGGCFPRGGARPGPDVRNPAARADARRPGPRFTTVDDARQ
jgi:hypothetical protein